MNDQPTPPPAPDKQDVTALRKLETVLDASAGPAQSGITLAIGRLSALDQQIVRTMLQTLATRLSAFFRASDAEDGEVVLEASAADPASFILRARKGSRTGELRLPKPLRLMPLADGLNAMIDVIRPQSLDFTAATAKHESTLGAVLGDAAPAPQRYRGAWGQCVSMPGKAGFAFDRPYAMVARALAEDACVRECETISTQIAETLHGTARMILRREEIIWLCGPAIEFQRAVAVKLAHPDAFIKLAIWPNLARLPDHLRWISVFARLQRGASLAAVLEVAAVEGLGEVQARRGLYVLLQMRLAELSLRPPLPPGAAEPATIPSPSFMQRLRTRLRQLMEAR